MPTDPLEVINLGTFIQYSKPFPIEHTFLDGDGVEVDMGTGDWTGEIEGKQLHVTSQPSGIFTGTPTVDTDTSAITHTLTATDLGTVGRFRFTLYAGNGTSRVGQTFEYHVSAGLNEAPSN